MRSLWKNCSWTPTTTARPTTARATNDTVQSAGARLLGGQACSINKLMACMRSDRRATLERTETRVTVTSAPCCRRRIERQSRRSVGRSAGRAVGSTAAISRRFDEAIVARVSARRVARFTLCNNSAAIADDRCRRTNLNGRRREN